jgi:hypothetical protein
VRWKVAASIFGKAEIPKAEGRNRGQSRFIKSGMGRTPYDGRAITPAYISGYKNQLQV